MAIKIKMLSEKMIPVLYKAGERGKIYKVNSEVAEELVAEGIAEYADPEMAAMNREKEVTEKPEMETAMIEPEEKAVVKKGKPRKFGR